MYSQPIPEKYYKLTQQEIDERILAHKAELGEKLVVLGHHYQRDEVILNRITDHKCKMRGGLSSKTGSHRHGFMGDKYPRHKQLVWYMRFDGTIWSLLTIFDVMNRVEIKVQASFKFWCFVVGARFCSFHAVAWVARRSCPSLGRKHGRGAEIT